MIRRVESDHGCSRDVYCKGHGAHIHTVEKPGFIHLLKVLDPRYVLPSRKYFSYVALPQLYNSTRQRIATELGRVSFYSATTDL